MSSARRKGRVLSFFLGMLLGIILLAGAIVGVGYWAISGVKVSTLQEWFNINIIKGDDPEDINNKSVLDIIDWAPKFFGDSKNLTINKINATFGEYIPVTIDMGNGASISLAPLADIPITELGNNVDKLLDCVNVGTLKSLLGSSLPSIPIIDNIANDQPLTAVFDAIQSAIDPDLMTLHSLSTNFGIALPDHALINKLKDEKLAALGGNINDIIMGSTLVEVLGEEMCAGNDLLTAVKDFKLSELSTKFPTLTIRQLLGDDVVAGNNLLLAIADCSMDTIADKIPTLTIRDLLGDDQITGNKLLEAIADCTMNNIASTIPTLQIGQLVDVGTEGILFELRNSTLDTIQTDIMDVTLSVFIPVTEGQPKILTVLQSKKLGEIGNAIEGLTIGDVIEPGGNELLTALTNQKDTAGNPYKLTEISTAVSQLLNSSSMREIMVYSGQTAPEALPHPLKPQITDLYTLSLTDFISEITVIIDALSQVPSLP